MSSSGSTSFLSLLTVLFVGLKLTNHITWSWYIVLAPLWAPLVIVAVVLAVALVCAVIEEMT
jgi:hypothetical protein